MIGRESLNADQKQSDMMQQLEKIVERMAKWDDTRQALFLLDTHNKVLKNKLARMEDRYERLRKKYFEGKEMYEDLYRAFDELLQKFESAQEGIQSAYDAMSDPIDEASNLFSFPYQPDEWDISDPSEEEDEEEDERDISDPSEEEDEEEDESTSTE